MLFYIKVYTTYNTWSGASGHKLKLRTDVKYSCQALGPPLELDLTLGLSLDLLFLRLLSISIPVILSDRNNYGLEL